MPITIRALSAEDAPTCDQIILSLPEWFGHEGGRAACAEAVRSQPGVVAEEDGRVLGFVTWAPRTPATAEASWMAVHRDRRGQRIGTAIIERLADDVRARGFRLLLAMTSAAHNVPNSGEDNYEATRRFWQHRGFVPLAELDLREWETDIALLLVRPL